MTSTLINKTLKCENKTWAQLVGGKGKGDILNKGRPETFSPTNILLSIP